MHISKRIIKVSIEFEGDLVVYSDNAISVTGVKTTSKNKDQFNVKIINVAKEKIKYLIDSTSIYKNKVPKKNVIYVTVGREGEGETEFIRGNIIDAKKSGFEDQTLDLTCTVGGFNRGSIVTNSFLGLQKLSSIAERVAKDNDLKLIFLIKDKNISNYNYTGSKVNQINKLQALADCDVYQDGGELVLKNASQSRTTDVVRQLTSNDIVGNIKETAKGIDLTMLFDQITNIGSRVQVSSTKTEIYNGIWVCYKLGFNLTNRDTPFYLSPSLTPFRGSST